MIVCPPDGTILPIHPHSQLCRRQTPRLSQTEIYPSSPILGTSHLKSMPANLRMDNLPPSLCVPMVGIRLPPTPFRASFGPILDLTEFGGAYARPDTHRGDMHDSLLSTRASVSVPEINTHSSMLFMGHINWKLMFSHYQTARGWSHSRHSVSGNDQHKQPRLFAGRINILHGVCSLP